jgi:hypothetical protein
MPRFEEALRAAAASLDLPQPDRARILEEIAVDLEDLRTELVRRGVPEGDAEARAVELLVPSDVAVRALVNVHEPLYRSLTRRFSPSAMRRTDRVGLLVITLLAIGVTVVPVVRSGLVRDPSPLIVPILATLAGLLIVAGRKAIQLYVEGDHEPLRLRSGLDGLLIGSVLAIGCALVGFIFELYRLMVGIEASPERVGPLMVRWILDTSVLVGAGLVTTLAGGLCWFLLLHKVEAVERAYLHEESFTGSPRATSTSFDHPLAPKGALR